MFYVPSDRIYLIYFAVKTSARIYPKNMTLNCPINLDMRPFTFSLQQHISVKIRVTLHYFASYKKGIHSTNTLNKILADYLVVFHKRLWFIIRPFTMYANLKYNAPQILRMHDHPPHKNSLPCLSDRPTALIRPYKFTHLHTIIAVIFIIYLHCVCICVVCL